jgi:hypothetical protein
MAITVNPFASLRSLDRGSVSLRFGSRSGSRVRPAAGLSAEVRAVDARAVFAGAAAVRVAFTAVFAGAAAVRVAFTAVWAGAPAVRAVVLRVDPVGAVTSPPP